MVAASFKESGSDHMWAVLFFFHGVVQRQITYSCKCIKPDCVFIHFLFNRVGITVSSRRFFLLLTSVSKYTESVQYTIYIYVRLGLWKLVSFLLGTGLISSCFSLLFINS